MARQIQPSGTTSWVWLALFAVIIALTGGSSRSDAIQIVALRPAAALLLIPAIYFFSFSELRRAKMLVVLLGLFVLWTAAQLVPLPPAIWHGLAGRELLSRLDDLIGLNDVWRPISWVPSRGMNSLASLVVPVVALLLALSMRASQRMLLILVAGLAFFDGLLGLLQVIGGERGLLYTYAITNHGSPVGIFANENHSAVFSAIAMLVLTKLFLGSAEAKDPAWLKLAFVPAYLVVLLSVMVSGSRAGFALATISIVLSGAMVWVTSSRKGKSRRGGRIYRWLSARPWVVPAMFSVAIAAIAGLFISFDRIPGLDGLFENNTFEDIRWSLWPVLEQIMRAHWLVGIGFGSFEEFYHIYEPTELLLPNYVNQAHNDWAQLVIEGGAPALAVVATLLAWIVFAIIRLMRNVGILSADTIFWSAAVLYICAASIVDYPLRAPAFQVVAIWLLLGLALDRQSPSAPSAGKQSAG